MTLYIVGLVLSIIAWIIPTAYFTTNAYSSTYTWQNRAYRAKYAARARLAWLAFFLIPLYPAVICVALVFGPIMVFRHLGRIGKETQ